MRISVAFLALMASLCATAGAQDFTPHFEVGGFAGGQFWKPLKDKYPLPLRTGSGGVFGGRLGYDATSRFGFELTGAYGANEDGFELSPGAGVNRVDFGARNFQLMAGPVMYLRPYGSRIRPFLTAGPALQYFWPTEAGRNLGQSLANLPVGPVRLDDNITGALHYGGGVKAWITEKLNARVDVRGIFSANPHIRYFAEPARSTQVPWPSGGLGHGLQITGGLGYSIGAPGWGTLTAAPASGLRVEIAGPNRKIYQGDQASFTASTDAPAGTPVKYNWRVNNQPAGEGESVNLETTGLTPGTYAVEVSASAPGLGSARDLVHMDVLQVSARDIPFSINAPGGKIYRGDPASFSIRSELPADAPITYNWTVDGKPSGAGSSFSLDTRELPPGTYKVEATASGANYKSSTQSATLAVLQPFPPQIRLTAPAEVVFPQKVQITTSATAGEGGGMLGPVRLSASDGSIANSELDTSTVQFDQSTPGTQRKVINLTATVADSKGLTASATGSVTVVRKVTAEPVRLPDVVFARNSSRVNNCGKRVLLEEVKAYIDRDPTGRVILVSHMDRGEMKVVTERRGRNAAAALTAGKGICLGVNPRQVLIGLAGTNQSSDPMPFLCGTSTSGKSGKGARAKADKRAQYRRVEVWFVPTGAQLPPGLGRLRTAAAYKVSTLGCPK
ncbi:MAG: PKD domain-containing protein [Bryobacteraceae bacterium]|nr:PKD domain-containing protein [Bryobacteraceae bacterium]